MFPASLHRSYTPQSENNSSNMLQSERTLFVPSLGEFEPLTIFEDENQLALSLRQMLVRNELKLGFPDLVRI